jgi:hypothetical protein
MNIKYILTFSLILVCIPIGCQVIGWIKSTVLPLLFKCHDYFFICGRTICYFVHLPRILLRSKLMMILKNIAIAMLLSLTVVGCATSPVPPSEANVVPSGRVFSQKYATLTSNKQSTLTFIRDSGLYGAGENIHLYINGEDMASFRPSEKLQVFLNPGEYLIGVHSVPSFGVEQFVETPYVLSESQSYSFRIGIDSNRAIVQRTSAF